MWWWCAPTSCKAGLCGCTWSADGILWVLTESTLTTVRSVSTALHWLLRGLISRAGVCDWSSQKLGKQARRGQQWGGQDQETSEKEWHSLPGLESQRAWHPCCTKISLFIAKECWLFTVLLRCFPSMRGTVCRTEAKWNWTCHEVVSTVSGKLCFTSEHLYRDQTDMLCKRKFVFTVIEWSQWRGWGAWTEKGLQYFSPLRGRGWLVWTPEPQKLGFLFLQP